MKYIGICPSSSGFFQAAEVEVTADTLADAHTKIWGQLIGSRYCSRIYQQVMGQWQEVWHEGQSLTGGTA